MKRRDRKYLEPLSEVKSGYWGLFWIYCADLLVGVGFFIFATALTCAAVGHLFGHSFTYGFVVCGICFSATAIVVIIPGVLARFFDTLDRIARLKSSI